MQDPYMQGGMMGQPYGMDPYAPQPGMMGSMAPGYGAPGYGASPMPGVSPSVIQPLAAGLKSMIGGGMGGSMGMGGGMGYGGMGGGMGMYT